MSDTGRPAPDLRHVWQERVPYNKACGIEITRWDAAGVVIELPERDWLMNGLQAFHGGAVAALCDSAAGGAVMAGHPAGDGRLATISMTVQYLAPARGRLRAEARCVKRGRQVSFAEVTVTRPDGEAVAQAMVSITIAPLRDQSGGGH